MFVFVDKKRQSTNLFQFEKFNVECQNGIGWNHTWMAPATICIVWGTDQFGAFTNGHLKKIQGFFVVNHQTRTIFFISYLVSKASFNRLNFSKTPILSWGTEQIRPIVTIWKVETLSSDHLFAETSFSCRSQQFHEASLCSNRLFYLGNTFIPTFDYFSLSNAELKWLSASPGRIEYGTVLQCAGVVHNNGLVLLWVGATWKGMRKHDELLSMVRYMPVQWYFSSDGMRHISCNILMWIGLKVP